ncbi:hypothetical protein [Catalinimonas alkaloidigena]|nr:hypothetical protein [Catalinimonas alkaloidigena]
MPAQAQLSRKTTEPEFKVTYEGYEIDTREGLYIPKEGFFQIDLANQQELYASLPDDAYISFISSEARLISPQDGTVVSMTQDHEFLDNDLDLIPIMRQAAAHDKLELEVKYVYVARKGNGKTKVLKEGSKVLSVPLK